MADENIYDEIEIEDMTWDPTMQIYHYPCPCGDRFEISIDDLRDEETDIAVCPSCSLQIRVIYEVDDLPKPESEQKQEEVKKSVETQAQQPVAAAAAILLSLWKSTDAHKNLENGKLFYLHGYGAGASAAVEYRTCLAVIEQLGR